MGYLNISKKVLSASAFLLAILAMCGSALAQGGDSDNDAALFRSGPGRIVYIETNERPNAVQAYQRDDAGQLTPLPGGRFWTGGSGVIDPSLQLTSFDTDQNIVIDRKSRLLFAVNSGSNSIAVFRIRPTDGHLEMVPGSPFSSGGINPVSVGLRGDQIVIVNQNMDPAQNIAGSLPSIVTRHVSPSGRIIKLLKDTEINLPANSSPSQALTANVSPFVFNADLVAGLLESYQLSPDGALRANPAQSGPASLFPPGTPAGTLGLWAHPHARQLYVGYPTVNQMGVYTWDEKGVPILERTVANSGSLICWFRTNQAGTRLYTGNSGTATAAQSMSVYDITKPDNPIELQTLVLKGPGQVFQFELDPAEQFIYAVSQRNVPEIPITEGNALHVLKIDAHGLLEEVRSSPLVLHEQIYARPQGVAVY